MSTSVRNIPDLIAQAVQVELAKARLDMLKTKVGTIFHADASTAIATLPVASDLPSVIARANAIKATYNAHIASACNATTGVGAHIAADATNVVSSANASDQATANTLLNEIKADYNTHIASTSFHPTADATNAIAAANASDLATSITLVNELYTDINAHMAAAMNHQAIVLVAP
ncbi:MAG: hypothetical protein HOW73_47610 [Polyangiaceae bacterium]|nr:hypothetical protein [Polyangiaceae bacterium]